MSKSKKLQVVGTLAAIAIIAGAAFAASPAFAAKGGKHGGGQTGGGTGAALSVSPNPVNAYTTFTVSGSGLSPNTEALVGVVGQIPFDRVTTDSSGSFSYTYTQLLPPWPTYELTAEQGAKVVGSLVFAVQ